MVLLRFAPSPTGPLHLGGLRTALFNHLYARRHGGKWILRIEDTDATRHVPGSVDGIRSALEWAGLDYDHGPGRDGPHAPYYQSERLDLYHTYARKLLDSGHAYRCFCTPENLSDTRERLARTGSNSTYDKACLRLTEEEVGRKVRAGEKFVVRFNDTSLTLRQPAPEDLIFGNLRDAHASLPTDPILLKSDQFPTYHLANVVDDTEMGVTHVLRGEEWLPSLPLHLDLHTALRLPPPKYAHLPLLLNKDGSKMSKRKGDVSVLDYMKRGWEPEAVLNWLALAGWGVRHHDAHPDPSPNASSSHETPSTSSPSSLSSSEAPASAPAPHDSTTVLTLSELIEQFDLTALTHRRTILDPSKLAYLNKHHLILAASSSEALEALAQRVKVATAEAFPTSRYTNVEYIQRVITVLGGGRLVNIADIPTSVPYLFVEPDYNTEEARVMVKGVEDATYDDVVRRATQRLEDSAATSWDEVDLNVVTTDPEYKPKVVMTVLRHVLSGTKAGPSVHEIMGLLGRERTLERLTR